MNEIFIISPLVGSVIGYFTNWLAIKMLFRPLNEKKIAGFKIPFTPGVIPRRRKALAENIGDTVGNTLLTPDAFENMLQGEEMQKKVRGFIRQEIKKLEDEDRSLAQILGQVIDNQQSLDLEKEAKELIVKSIENLLKEGLTQDKINSLLKDLKLEKIIEYFNRDDYKNLKVEVKELIADLLKKDSLKGWLNNTLQEKVERAKDNGQSLKEIIPPSIINKLKEYLAQKEPELVEQLVQFLSSDSMKEKIGAKINESFGNAPFLKMIENFIDKDKLIAKLVDYIAHFLEEPSNQKEMMKQIDGFLDSLLETKVSDIAQEIDDQVLDELSQFILKEFPVEEIIDSSFGFLEDSLIEKIKEYNAQDSKELALLLSKLINNKLITNILEKVVGFSLKRIMQSPLSLYFNKLTPERINKFEAGIISIIEYLMEHHLAKVLASLDFKIMVQKKINSFDVLEVERLLLDVIETELQAITWFGAVLGFIMGLITPIISIIMG